MEERIQYAQSKEQGIVNREEWELGKVRVQEVGKPDGKNLLATLGNRKPLGDNLKTDKQTNKKPQQTSAG